MTLRTFVTDTLKEWSLGFVIGVPLISALLWIVRWAGSSFVSYVVVFLFSVFLSLVAFLAVVTLVLEIGVPRTPTIPRRPHIIPRMPIPLLIARERARGLVRRAHRRARGVRRVLQARRARRGRPLSHTWSSLDALRLLFNIDYDRFPLDSPISAGNVQVESQRSEGRWAGYHPSRRAVAGALGAAIAMGVVVLGAGLSYLCFIFVSS